MGNITSIVGSGADAFTNLFDVVITYPKDVVATPDASLTVRIGNFTPPEGTQETYDTPYHSGRITRLKPMIILERKLNMEFRVDANYNIYQHLMQWKHLWMNPSDEGDLRFGAYSNTTHNENNTGTIVVNALNSTALDTEITNDPRIGASWTYNYVICTKVGQPAYSREGSNELKVTAEFLFLTTNEGVIPTTNTTSDPNNADNILLGV